MDEVRHHLHKNLVYDYSKERRPSYENNTWSVLKMFYKYITEQQRRRFSDELTDEISHVFAYYITKKITPPLAECRCFLVNQKGQEAQRSPKAIQDKVRSLMSKGV